jgi:hypothetical protein
MRHLVFPLLCLAPEDYLVGLVVFGSEDSFALDSVVGGLSFPLVDKGRVDLLHEKVGIADVV